MWRQMGRPCLILKVGKPCKFNPSNSYYSYGFRVVRGPKADSLFDRKGGGKAEDSELRASEADVDYYFSYGLCIFCQRLKL